METTTSVEKTKGNLEPQPRLGEVWSKYEEAFARRGAFERQKTIVLSVAETPPAYFDDIFERLSLEIDDETPTMQHAEMARGLLVDRWAVEDPETAFEWVLDAYKRVAAHRIDLFSRDVQSARFDVAARFMNEFIAQDPTSAFIRIQELTQAESTRFGAFMAAVIGDPSSVQGDISEIYEGLKNVNPAVAQQLGIWVFREKLNLGLKPAIEFLAENSDAEFYGLNPMNRYGEMGHWEKMKALVIESPEETLTVLKQLDDEQLRTGFGRHILRIFESANDLESVENLALLFLQRSFKNIHEYSGVSDPFAPPSRYSQGSKELVRETVKIVSAIDVDRALHLADLVDDPIFADDIRGEVATFLAKTDPERAMGICLGLDDQVGSRYLGSVVSEFMLSSPDSAGEILDQFDPAGWALDQQSTVLNTLWAIDYMDAIDFLNDTEFHPELRSTIERKLHDFVADGKFEEYARVIEALPPMNLDDSFRDQNFARKWAHSDFEAALGYVLHLPLGERRSRLVEQLVQVHARKPQNSLPELAYESEEFMKAYKMNNMYSDIKLNPIKAIETWGEEKVVAVWASRDPSAAYEYLDNIDDPGMRAVVIDRFANSGASSANFSEISSILDTLPNSSEKETAVRNLADRWAATNPSMVAEWVDAMPASDAKDSAIYALTEHLVEHDYELAFDWSMGIGNDDRRAWISESIVSKFAKADPSGAREMVEAYRMDFEERKQLLEAIGE
ncbi:MAG: hypothetical protein ACPGN3_02905 [Opitutales bacterium]